MTISANVVNNGITTKDTTLILKCQLDVLDDNRDNYMIQFQTDNLLIISASRYYPELSNKISNNTNLSMHIKVHKDSYLAEVLDSLNYCKAIDTSCNEILEILKTNTPDKLDSAKIELDKLCLSLKEKSEATRLIDLITESYKVQYSKTDTLVTTDSLQSPFNKTKLIGATVKTHVEKKSKNTNLIIVEKKYNFDVKNDLMININDQFTSVTDSTLPDEDSTYEMNQIQEMYKALMASYQFDGYESFIITRDKNSNWPISLLKKTDMNIKVQNIDTRALIDILIEIK